MTPDLILYAPKEWSNTKRGNFFEDFVGELLRPMHFEVNERLRFTGMEIDLLAKHLGEKRRLFVECKAQRDPLSSSVISQLLGNVSIERVDAGWLFSVGGLSKDAKGLREKLNQDPEQSRRFAYYGPSDITLILINQDSIVEPKSLEHLLPSSEIGGWTLLVSPDKRVWLAEILESALPVRYSAFEAASGAALEEEDVNSLVQEAAPRFAELTYKKGDPSESSSPEDREPRAPVAAVIAGDTWEDLRPARPTDFVGRETILSDVRDFMESVRIDTTSTRSFAVQGPSGWGKSSFLLKLGSMAQSGEILNCSFTAVDTRSATGSGFVAESLRMAFVRAAEQGLIADRNYTVESLHHPLSSDDLQKGIEELSANDAVCVLIFDQFEELFSKEDLFGNFSAVRDLSLALDAVQVPLCLGFSWKTDVALPQEHPAYHLWHELADRRRTFRIPEFGTGEMKKVIAKGEKALGSQLSNPVKTRLIEQCQGLPWLLKKLLVHVLQRVPTVESQYQLLERELDVELLFESDLSELSEHQIECLEYVAERSPISVTEVEDNFSRAITNSLIGSRLIVRSGLNYSIYWDIFRDYLVEGSVPHIPWARTFQRDPNIAVRALQALNERGPLTTPELGAQVGLKEGPSFNLLLDLVSLQLVERVPGDRYKVASHLVDTLPGTVAEHARGQLRKHVVAQEIERSWATSLRVTFGEWNEYFAGVHPRTSDLSKTTIHHYAANLRRWLVFAGLLEQSGYQLSKPARAGRQMGTFVSQRSTSGRFLGTTAPDTFEELLKLLHSSEKVLDRRTLKEKGFRNATSDGAALGLFDTNEPGLVRLDEHVSALEVKELLQEAQDRVLEQNTIQVTKEAIVGGVEDGASIGNLVEDAIGAQWSQASKRRYGNGLRRYYQWASSSPSTQEELDI